MDFIVRYRWLLCSLATSAISVLGVASAGWSDSIQTSDIQTVTEETAEPISNRAADLSATDLSATDLSATVIRGAFQSTENSATSENTPVSSEAIAPLPHPSPVTISTIALPELTAPVAQAEPVSAPTDAPAAEPSVPADPAAELRTTPSAESTPTEQTSQPGPTYDPNAGLRIPSNLGEGRPVERVYVYLRNPTGDPAKDEALQKQLTEAFSFQAGTGFSPLFADRAVSQVQQLPFVESAEYRLYESDIPGRVIVALLVTLKPEDTTLPPTETRQPRGIFVSGSFRDFPTLFESDRTLIKFVLNGSLGVFSDTHSWFGNPQNFVAGSYQPNGTITWGEFSLEPGLAGITRLGNDPLYLYGAVTYSISSTVQPDIFRADNRFYGAIEQLYGGVLFAERGRPYSLNLSAGRQKFQLNQGFLFSQFSGSANALERGGSFLSPRTAYEMTVLADLRFGDVRLRGFFLQPDELPVADSETQYLGATLSYSNNRNLELSLTYVNVPQSSRVYALPGGGTATREGLQVINPRIRLSSLFGVSGLWAEAEYAHEFSNQFSMSANAGYLWVGYTAQNVSWRPSISYRFAGFSGDNPNTSTYERFDPLQAGGLSDWLQGLSLGKVFNNSNSFSHRVSISVQPSESLSLSLDYYYRFADQLNNVGGNRALQTLQSRDIGHEFVLIARYFLSQNFLLQGVTSVAFPGAAIRRAVCGPADPWFTFQVSLFMFF